MRLLAGAVVLIASAGTAHGQVALTPKQIAARFLGSVVSIRTKTAKGVVTGTGFFYCDGRTIATSKHVVDGATEIRIVARDGAVWEPEAIGINHPADTAMLRLGRDTGRRFLPHAPSSSVSVGDPVVVIGDPLGLSGSVSTGIVSALRKIRGVPEIQFTAPISPGSSGGPLIDGKGRAIGIVRSTYVQGQNLNVAVSTVVAKPLHAMVSKLFTTDDEPVFAIKSWYMLNTEPDSGEGPRPATLDRGATDKALPSEIAAGVRAAERQAIARSEIAGHVAKTGDLFEADSRWAVMWLETEFQDVAIGGPSLIEAQRRLFDACDLPYLASLRLDAESAGVPYDDLKPFVDGCLAISELAGERAMADSAIRVARAATGRAGLDQAIENGARQAGRVKAAIFDLLTAVGKVGWINTPEFDAQLSPTIFGSAMLGGFDAYLDYDLPGSCTVRHALPMSQLRQGDRIVGVADSKTGAFSPVYLWSDVRTYMIGNGKNARPIVRLRVVRSGVEMVVSNH